MDFPIDQVGSWIEQLTDNWELISVSVLAFVASLDKLALVVITTMKNIKQAWKDSFPSAK